MRDVAVGSRIRQKRLDLGLRQADLAKSVGISASYLNLIEHNRRRIGGALLTRLADALEMDPQLLSEGGSARLVEALSALGGPERADEFAGRFPDWAQFLLAQSRRITALEETISGLDDRLTHDPVLSEKMHDVLSTVSAIRSTSSILVDTPELDAEWRARFHANIDAESQRLAETSAAMAAHFDRLGQSDRDFATPLEAAYRFFDKRGFSLPEIEEPGGAAITGLLDGAPEITTPDARAQVQQMLERYAGIAEAMPLEPFVSDTNEVRHDPAALARHYNVSLEDVFLRFAHLPLRADLPEMGYVACDLAGGLTMRRAAPGFAMPRFGAACPLWPLFAALTQPGRPLRQRLTTSEGATYAAYAVAPADPISAFEGPTILQASMLLIREDAEATSTDPPHFVGASCRVCSKANCAARREGSILTRQP